MTRRTFLALLAPTTIATGATVTPRAAAQPQRHYHGEREGAHVWVVFRRLAKGDKS